jgi:hypothetical protein
VGAHAVPWWAAVHPLLGAQDRRLPHGPGVEELVDADPVEAREPVEAAGADVAPSVLDEGEEGGGEVGAGGDVAERVPPFGAEAAECLAECPEAELGVAVGLGQWYSSRDASIVRTEGCSIAAGGRPTDDRSGARG